MYRNRCAEIFHLRKKSGDIFGFREFRKLEKQWRGTEIGTGFFFIMTKKSGDIFETMAA